MRDVNLTAEPARVGQDLSLLLIAAAVVRRLRLVVVFCLAGAVMGLVAGLRHQQTYVATATFVPETVTGGGGALAEAATQFGIRVPSSSEAWGPPVYVRLIRSREILDAVAADTAIVFEEDRRKTTFAELVPATAAVRRAQAGQLIGLWISANETKDFEGVELRVATRWPSVSKQLAERLLAHLSAFNLEKHRSRASAERQFVEARAADAERQLRAAEANAQGFLQQNRSMAGSPVLTVQFERLQREVSLRQQSYLALAASREEARIREVRDTPVFTILESPRMPMRPESRQLTLRTIAGGLAGATAAVVLALLLHAGEALRASSSPEASEFQAALRAAMRPRREAGALVSGLGK